MTGKNSIPKGAEITINDMLDCCARLQRGQKVVIAADLDDVFGKKDWDVDELAIEWIKNAVEERECSCEILWMNEPDRPDEWVFPEELKKAIARNDLLILHGQNLACEEMAPFWRELSVHKTRVVRNFAGTAPLLCSYWAQTPYELVSEIRFQASKPFVQGAKYVMTDPNGTFLEGEITAPAKKKIVPGPPYSGRRTEEGTEYYPYPEWLHPPVSVKDTNGVFVFDCMLSWWSRYIGISPYFNYPITLNIENNHITGIEGKKEADALRKFLKKMDGILGPGVWDFDTFHFGVHPQASVSPQQCPNVLLRRTIEHSDSCNLHIHIGAPPPSDNYPYWMHLTGDLRNPTLRVGNVYVYENGYLNALDDPAVKKIEEKYPGRPGTGKMPVCF